MSSVGDILYWIAGGCVWIQTPAGPGRPVAHVAIPFEQWNELLERVGRRGPEADRECPP